MIKYTAEDLLEIMKKLRQECPWDASQTHQSLKQYLLEETYEVLESIEDKNWTALSSELGDLLLQIVFHSEIAQESAKFNFQDVVQQISEKLISRHPHVFENKKLQTAEEVQENWEHSKVRDENRKSILSGVPKAAPALLQAQRLQAKAATVGFEWPDIKPVIEKFEEEWAEFKEALQSNQKKQIEGEFGDLLFSLVNLSRYYNINSEDSLRKTSKKFIRRFQYIENKYENDPKKMNQASLEELDKYWDEAKEIE